MGPDSRFRDLFDLEYRRVVGFVMLNGASAEDATDAAQEAFAEAWRLMQKDEWGRVEAPGAWLRSVALRRYRRPPGPRSTPLIDLNAEIPDRVDAVADPADHVTIRALVTQTLQSLPPVQRKVMAMFLDDIPTPHIARALGIAEATVRAHRAAARKKLRQALEARRGQEHADHTRSVDVPNVTDVEADDPPAETAPNCR